MSIEPKIRLRKITHSVILPAIVATGLTACALAREPAQMHEGIFYWPKGAVAPEGLDEITSNSTPDEVIQILGSRYEHFPKQLAGSEYSTPISDGFTYEEGGVTKYIEVRYRFGADGFIRKVGFVRYGYDGFRGIE